MVGSHHLEKLVSVSILPASILRRELRKFRVGVFRGGMGHSMARTLLLVPYCPCALSTFPKPRWDTGPFFCASIAAIIGLTFTNNPLLL